MPPHRRHWLAAALGVMAALIAASCSTDPEYAKREYVKSGDRFVEQKKYAEAIVQYRNALAAGSTVWRGAPQAGAGLRTTRRPSQRDTRVHPRRRCASQRCSRAGEGRRRAAPHTTVRGGASSCREGTEAGSEERRGAGRARQAPWAGLRDFDSALSEFEEAVKLSPNESALQQGIGSIQAARGRSADAEAAFRRAVELAPKNPRALSGTGQLSLVQRPLRGSRADVEECAGD